MKLRGADGRTAVTKSQAHSGMSAGSRPWRAGQGKPPPRPSNRPLTQAQAFIHLRVLEREDPRAASLYRSFRKTLGIVEAVQATAEAVAAAKQTR